MKKALFVLMALLIASPAMAVTLTATADQTAKTITIGWAGNGTDAASRARAFAFTVKASGGALIESVTGFNAGQGAKYGIFPGTISIVDGVVQDYNSPVEPATLPGAAGTGIDTNSVVLAMGSLYVGDTNAPAASGVLAVVKVKNVPTAGTTITVTPETTYRGGVVMEDATSPTVAAVSAVINGAEPECITSANATYAQWVAVGKPSSWCNKRQCHGDADNATEVIGKGTYYVGYNDVSVLVSGFKKLYPTPANPIANPWIAADFDRNSEVIGKGTYRVGYNDVNVLIGYFKKTTVPADCQ